MFIYLFISLHIQQHKRKKQDGNEKIRKREEMLSFRCGRKTPNEENQHSQVWTENPIHMQGSSLRWDSNQGPQSWKAGKETTEHQSYNKTHNHCQNC